MNRVILMGRLTRNAEIRYTQGEEQLAIARFTLAVDRRYKRDGQKETDFISCVAFGKTAEFMEKYGHQGVKFVAEGRWQTGSYEKDGQKHYTNDCAIDLIEFAESKKSQEQNQQPDSDGFVSIPDNIDEELPFN